MLKQRLYAFLVLAAYVAVLPIAAYCARQFVGNTKLVYKSVSGSIVERTEQQSAIAFPKNVLHKPIFLIARSTVHGERIDNSVAFRNFSKEIVTGFAIPNKADIASIIGFHSFPETSLFRLKYIGGVNNDSSLITVDVQTTIESMVDVLERWIKEWEKVWPRNASNFTVRTTSVPQIASDLQEGMMMDLLMIDMITIPFALAFLGYCIGSARALLIPVTAMPVTIIFCYACMYPISVATTVTSFAPELSAAVMIAITIDYSLFILSRFHEQRRIQARVFGAENADCQWHVVYMTTKLSAHNILISGLTIAASLGGLSLLPVGFISTVGMAFGIGACLAVFVSLTLQPAMLLAFYPFWVRPEFVWVARVWKKLRSRKGEKSINDTEERALLVGEDAATDETEREREEQRHSIWFRTGQAAFRHPTLVIFLLCISVAPFCYLDTKLEVDFDLFHQVPTDSPHANTLKDIIDNIGHGSALPFYVTFHTNQTNAVCSQPFFDLIHDVTMLIVNRTGHPMDRILTFASFGTIPVQWDWVDGLMMIDAYRFLWQNCIGTRNASALIGLYTTFDPFSYHSIKYINAVHDIVTTYNTSSVPGLQIGLMGASMASWSIMHEVMKSFPLLIALTFSVIFVFIAVVFRSLFIPLRLVFTVAYTIVAAFGFGILVFQYSIFDFFWGDMRTVASWVWVIPIFCFSLLCALALDYDIFLITRVLEYKALGFSDEAAISKGVWKTGRIISFAGVIMALAMGSLMFSNTVMLMMFGIVTTFAVFLDTFVIRTLFVPALMSAWPALSWWPRKFPDSNFGCDDMRESTT